MDVRALRVAVRSRLLVLGPRPIKGFAAQPSLVAPNDSRPSERLLDVALRAIEVAQSVDLRWLAARGGDEYPLIWPGEHYKLLTALVAVLGPKTVVEFGTATGLSALAMKSSLPAEGKVVTFDVVSWRELPSMLVNFKVALREEDFADGRLEQRVDDVSSPEGLRRNAEVLRHADFILVDTRHDGRQERLFLNAFEQVQFARRPIVMFDDTRLWGMLSFWREINRPKLDLTSFGHWSGTGLVDFA